MTDLVGIAPGSWCCAYHKTADRQLCGDRRCKFYVNHVITIGNNISTQNAEVPDFDEELNAISIKKPVIRRIKVNYVIGEECKWHCAKYDEPSSLEVLPWA